MAKKKEHDPDIDLQDCLDFIVESFEIFRDNGGVGTINPLGHNVVTAAPPTLIIAIPNVKAVGDKLILVEYATNATNGDNHE